MRSRSAEATWEGSLQEGSGSMRLGSGGYEGKYSFTSRFEEGAGSNPEELIAAAEAGCFSMALSGDLGRAGYSPRRVMTRAQVRLERVEGKFTITRIDLELEAEVPGIDGQTFQQIAEGARQNCPVSRALNVEIGLKARLV